MAVYGKITIFMQNNDEFIRKYNELDCLIGEKFNRESDDSSIYFLINKYRRSRLEKERVYSTKLDSIRKIRNLMVHESGIIDELFTVSDDVINFLDELIDYLRNPVRAKDVMTPLSKLIYGKKEDYLYYLIEKIVKDGISNIPILDEEKKVIGVFNSDVLLNLSLDKVKVNNETKILDIMSYVKLNNQLNLRFIFVTGEYEIDVLNDYFAFSKEQYKKRLPIIFVSVSGKETSQLLGIVSPIDLIRKGQ